MKEKLIILIIVMVLLGGIAYAANDTKDKDSNQDLIDMLTSVAKKTPPKPEETGSRESAKSGVKMYKIPGDGEVPWTFLFGLELCGVDKNDISYDDGVWTVQGDELRFGKNGEEIYLKEGEDNAELSIPTGEFSKGGFPEYNRYEVPDYLVDLIELDGIKDFDDTLDIATYNDKEVVFVDEGATIKIYRDYDGKKDTGFEALESETTIERGPDKKIVSTTKTTFIDDDNYADGEFDNPKPGNVEITTASGVKINADQSNGDVTVTYADGSSDSFGGTSGNLDFEKDKPYSFSVNGEFLAGPKTISVNPLTGEVFVFEKRGDDILIYDKNGKLLADTPVLSGKDYDGISATGGFFGAESGDYLSYEAENGGVDKIITKPKIVYVKDPKTGKNVPIVATGSKGYTIDFNYDVVNTPKGEYMISDGRFGTAAGLYYKVERDKDGNMVGLTTIDKTEQGIINNHRNVHITGSDGKTLTAQFDNDGNLIKNKDGKIITKDKDGNTVNLDPDSEEGKQLLNAKDVQENRGFWEGRSGAAMVGTVLSTYKSQSALTTAIWGEDKVAEWKENADKLFSKAYLGVDYWADEVCKKEFKTIGESAAIIETPSGLVQLIAHIEGEKTAELPDEQRFYKITFRVTAPADQALTPQVDEQGAISFNVRLIANNGDSVYLFVDERNRRRQDINLENGATYNAGGEDAILFYSSRNYGTVYIDFAKPILDRTNRYKKINEIHNVIVESSNAINNWFQSLESDTPGTPSGTSGGGSAGPEAPKTIINPDL